MNINIIKNNFFKIALALSPALGLLSCSDEIYDPGNIDTPSSGSRIILTTGDRSTRAEQIEGENKEENTISNYIIFFFKNPEENAVHFVSGLANEELKYDVPITLTTDNIISIFGDDKYDGKCTAYALVNLPEDFKITENGDNIYINYKDSEVEATIKNIEAITITYDFENTDQPGTFVMKGETSEINYSVDKNEVSGTINVKRVASKIRLWVNLPSSVYITQDNRIVEPDASGNVTIEDQIYTKVEFLETGGRIYTPVRDANFKLTLNNGVKKARIDGNTYNDEGNRWLESEDYFSIPRTSTLARNIEYSPEGIEKWKTTSTGKTYPFTHKIPLYSYPNAWENTIEETNQTSLLMRLDWNYEAQEKGSTVNGTEATYYQIPVNRQGDKTNIMESNMYYKIGLSVGMPGSTEIGDPLVIEEASWEAIEWTVEQIDVNLSENRYLVVNQTDWVMNNLENISIPFYTSHDVEVLDVKVSYWRFNDNWNGRSYLGQSHLHSFDNEANEETKLKNNGEGVFSINIDNENHTLNLSHPMITWDEYRYTNNNKTTNEQIKYDSNNSQEFNPDYFIKNGEEEFSPYVFVITIKHYDQNNNTEFQETITITQNPSIYIEVSHDPSNGGDDGNQYTFVNANNTDSNSGSWDNVTRLSQDFSGTNENPNMYVIHISQLSSDNYILGDPRSLDYNINLSDDSFTGKDDPHKRWNNNEVIFAANNSQTFTRRSAFIWSTTRNYTRTQTGGNLWNPTYRYDYTDYNLVPSIYENLKPDNIGSNASSETIGSYINNKNNLCYYYPADETPEGEKGSKEKFIAPILRVASSFAVVGQFDKASSRRRCASFQEAGRPAGRWRLPTKAEIKFMVDLSRQGKIPSLFGYSGTANNNRYAYYWTSTGAIGVNAAQGTTTEPTDLSGLSIGIRCVYDEWYWVKDDGKPDLAPGGEQSQVFTWGDKPKDNTQTPSN